MSNQVTKSVPIDYSVYGLYILFIPAVLVMFSLVWLYFVISNRTSFCLDIKALGITLVLKTNDVEETAKPLKGN